MSAIGPKSTEAICQNHKEWIGDRRELSAAAKLAALAFGMKAKTVVALVNSFSPQDHKRRPPWAN